MYAVSKTIFSVCALVAFLSASANAAALPLRRYNPYVLAFRSWSEATCGSGPSGNEANLGIATVLLSDNGNCTPLNSDYVFESVKIQGNIEVEGCKLDFFTSGDCEGPASKVLPGQCAGAESAFKSYKLSGCPSKQSN